MKYPSILIVLIFVLSGCGTKKAIEAQPETIKKIAIAEELPDVVQADKSEIYEMVEVVDSTGNSIVETSSYEEALELSHSVRTKDSIKTFNQDLKKRTLTEHHLWDALLKKHVTDDGNVNYKSFKVSHSDLLSYIDLLKKMYPEIDKVSREEKLAYWINVYNALTIDLIVRNYPTKSIKDIKEPWDQRLWKFGDKWQNLNDIEHKILREMNEPRIHFAIVCASVSCPKLQNQAFTAANLEEQLTNATKEFLADTSKNELSENNIKLSKIFKWFKEDFEKNGSLIDFLNQYSEVIISSDAKRSYKDYNWDLND